MHPDQPFLPQKDKSCCEAARIVQAFENGVLTYDVGDLRDCLLDERTVKLMFKHSDIFC